MKSKKTLISALLGAALLAMPFAAAAQTFESDRSFTTTTNYQRAGIVQVHDHDDWRWRHRDYSRWHDRDDWRWRDRDDWRWRDGWRNEYYPAYGDGCRVARPYYPDHFGYWQ